MPIENGTRTIDVDHEQTAAPVKDRDARFAVEGKPWQARDNPPQENPDDVGSDGGRHRGQPFRVERVSL